MAKEILVTKGERYGKLRVLRELEPIVTPGGQKQRQFRCACSCGNKSTVRLCCLRAGKTQSCGCKKVEASTTHGLRYSPLRARHRAMIKRCYRRSHPSFHNYGGRGIKVTAQFRSLEGFCKWNASLPIENQFRPGLTLERIDNNGDYGPHNCRWADRQEQARNRRDNYRVRFKGKWVLLIDLYDDFRSRRLCPVEKYNTVLARVGRGEPLMQALHRPIR